MRRPNATMKRRVPEMIMTLSLRILKTSRPAMQPVMTDAKLYREVMRVALLFDSSKATINTVKRKSPWRYHAEKEKKKED